jgi:hypothetical protein
MMTRNVGNAERMVRAVAGMMMILCAVMAPLPLVVRVAAFGALGTYMLFTALAGTCLGYKLIGKSTCPVDPTKGRAS